MDNHATTRVDERVLAVMLPYFCEHYGNSSLTMHRYARRAESAVDGARLQVAKIIGATKDEIFFTGTATESINLAIKGAAFANKNHGEHIITSMAEHKAVLNSCQSLEKQGFKVTYLKPESDGRILPEKVFTAITDRTILVTLMLANNENGVIHDVKTIGKELSKRKILFHIDAVQGVGKIPFDVTSSHSDYVSLSAHKMYGPKGVAALFIRKNPNTLMEPLTDGGGQEQGIRSGTHNVSGIVGFGEACRIAQEEMPEESQRLLNLRESLHQKIISQLDGVFLNGPLENRLPGNLNMSFAEIEGDVLLASLIEIAVSSGSACSAGNQNSSHVLRAQGVPDDLAKAAIRFGLGRYNTQEEVDFAAQLVIRHVKRLRQFSAF